MIEMSTRSGQQQPADLMLVTDAVREFGEDYTTIRGWWQTGRIRAYKRQGDGRVLVSRAEIELFLARQAQIVQIEPLRPGKRVTPMQPDEPSMPDEPS